PPSPLSPLSLPDALPISVRVALRRSFTRGPDRPPVDRRSPNRLQRGTVEPIDRGEGRHLGPRELREGTHRVAQREQGCDGMTGGDRKSTRLNSSHQIISY